MNKTPEEARILIQELAKESRVQQRKKSIEKISRVENTKMELTKRIDDLTSLVKNIASKSHEELPRSLNEENEQREQVNFVDFHMGHHNEERKRSSPIRRFKPRVSQQPKSEAEM